MTEQRIEAGDAVRLPEWPVDKGATVLEVLEVRGNRCLRLATSDPEGRRGSGVYLEHGFIRIAPGPVIQLEPHIRHPLPFE